MASKFFGGLNFLHLILCGILSLMRRFVVLSFLILLPVLLFPQKARAELLVVRDDGSVLWKVLSKEDEILTPRASYLEVKEAAKTEIEKDAKITLTRQNGKISLAVDGKTSYKELDVTDWNDSIVEIEERPATQHLKIGVHGERFSLEQEGAFALTSFPINIDTRSAELSLVTPTGSRKMSIMPRQALESMLRAKMLTRVNKEGVEIVEGEQGLAYRISGEKIIDILGIVEYPVEIDGYVSALTGEVVSVEAPTWYKVLSFFLT